MIRVTMQKNVLVFTADQAFTFTHQQFVEWLATNNVTEFFFRPGSKGDSIATRRANAIKKAGYSVSESGDVYHYLKAVA